MDYLAQKASVAQLNYSPQIQEAMKKLLSSLTPKNFSVKGLVAYGLTQGHAQKVDTYPLNQAQISLFTEELLKTHEEKERITAWDVYNVATEIYKPQKSDFPTLIPQNVAFADMITSFINK